MLGKALTRSKVGRPSPGQSRKRKVKYVSMWYVERQTGQKSRAAMARCLEGPHQASREGPHQAKVKALTRLLRKALTRLSEDPHQVIGRP